MQNVVSIGHAWFAVRSGGISFNTLGWIVLWLAVALPGGETRWAIRAWQAVTLLSVYGLLTDLLRLNAYVMPHAGPMALLSGVMREPWALLWIGLLAGRVVWYLSYLFSLYRQAPRQRYLERLQDLMYSVRLDRHN